MLISVCKRQHELSQRVEVDIKVCGNVHLQGTHDVAGLKICRGHQKLGDELDLLVLRFAALYSCNVPELPASMGDCLSGKQAWRSLQAPGSRLTVTEEPHINGITRQPLIVKSHEKLCKSYTYASTAKLLDGLQLTGRR